MSRIFVVRLTIIALAGLWLCSHSVAALVEEYSELNRVRDKVEQMDERQRSFVITIEGRLTRLETNLENISWLLRGVCGAVGLLVLETFYGAVMNWRRQARQGDG